MKNYNMKRIDLKSYIVDLEDKVQEKEGHTVHQELRGKNQLRLNA